MAGLTVSVTLGNQPLAIAQVTSDNSLSTTATSSDNLNFMIDGGTRVGSHLFHSFDQFSILISGSGTFNNASDIANIFSRVTGGAISDIQGRISANGTTNLFLINPAGITFGENAVLNIGGSFIATTAESLIFGDELEFSAIRPGSSVPLLSVNVSPGLQMGQQSGSIIIDGSGHSIIGGGISPFADLGTASGLQVNPGQTLGIVASDIDVEGGIIRAPGANILFSSAAEGTLTLRQNLNSWILDPSTVETSGDIQLSRQALIESSGALSGDIHLQGRNIQVTDGSLITLQNLGTQPGGEIYIDATESLQLFGANRISPDQDTVFGLIRGVALSRITNETLGPAAAGDIQITSRHVQIEDGGTINTRSYGSGSAGNLNINVKDTLELGGTSPLLPNFVTGLGSFTFNTGDAGNLQVNAQNLYMSGGALLGSGTLGAGKVGDVDVQVAQEIIIKGFEPAVASPSSLVSIAGGSGDSGRVVINTAQLSLLNGGVLATSSLADGNAGSLIVNASDSIVVSGNVPGSVIASSLDSSAAVTDEIFRQQVGVPEQPRGNSGNIQINTPRLMISDGGIVAVRNQGRGDSGRLQINADEIVLDQQGRISAFSASGQGGDIELNLGRFLLLNHGSAITVEAVGRLSNADPAQANVDGGNITINAPIILGVNNSDITADALEGNGGNININTQGLFGLEFRERLTPGNDITASSEFGLNGTININTSEIEFRPQMSELPEMLVDINQLIRSGCFGGESQFVLTGRGGLPSEPINHLTNGNSLWVDTRNLLVFLNGLSEESLSSLSTNTESDGTLQEAMGMITTSDGKIQLISPNSSVIVTSHSLPTCISHSKS